VVAAVFEGGNLERAGDAAEVRHDDLVALDRAVEEHLAQARVRGLVLEHAGAGDGGAAHARLAEELAPAPGRFGVRHVDGLGIEGELARAQARHGDEATGAVGDLDEKVLAFLSGHDAFLVDRFSPSSRKPRSGYPGSTSAHRAWTWILDRAARVRDDSGWG